MKYSEKLYHAFIYFNTSIIVTVIALGGYWLYLDEILHPPLTFNVDIQNFQTDKTEYKSGEEVSILSSFCKNRTTQASVSWNLVDTVIRTYPTQSGELEKGCYGVERERYFTIVKLPPELPEGVYYLQGIGRVPLNPIKTVEYSYKTQKFNVIK